MKESVAIFLIFFLLCIFFLLLAYIWAKCVKLQLNKYIIRRNEVLMGEAA